jgi:cob(I)alamin adenosyltransferase
MSDESNANPASSAYKERAERIKQSYEQRKAEATREKGLIAVFTGNGKGKSTAAFGMLLRALEHGMHGAVVQFVKGAIDTAEPRAFAHYGERLAWHRTGEGFSWITQDPERDREAAERAFALSCELMARPDLHMLVLDEIVVSMRRKQLDEAKVLAALANKREDLHVVLTGRGASDELMALADLVTEMKMVKHHYRAGIKAQAGIEF